MRERIWNELTQAKHNAEFATLYLERQKKLLNLFYFIILVFSTSGIMGWKFWDDYPIMACGIVSGLSLLRLIQPHIIMNEKTLSKLERVHIFYCNYFNSLDKIWYQMESEELKDTQLRDTFFNLINEEIEINKVLNELNLRHPKRLVNKAKLYSDQYFERVFNVKS